MKKTRNLLRHTHLPLKDRGLVSCRLVYSLTIHFGCAILVPFDMSSLTVHFDCAILVPLICLV